MVRSLAKRVLERDLSIRAGAKVERANAVAQGGRGVAERADDSSSSAAQCTAACALHCIGHTADHGRVHSSMPVRERLYRTVESG
uniref:Uncharacterized protein n=1 Tax=Pristionchus pacificus TaxID=54126 RepID=A0A2A6CLG3_PRIPA|eukprot:PDM78940.1 hypothetical protein PRIPAC_31519 [Pristionchus pacificus]